MNPPVQLAQAHAALQQGNIERAVSQCNEVLASFPQNFEALYLLGCIHAQFGKFDGAVAYLERAAAADSRNAVAHNMLGRVLADTGRYPEALAAFDSALAIQENFAEAHGNRGRALHAIGRIDDALLSFGQAIALNPGFADTYNDQGIALRDLGRHREALAAFDAAIARDPRYAEAFSNRGNILNLLGEPEAALASHDQAIALNPRSAMAHCNRAAVFADMKRTAEALSDLDRAITLDQRYTDAHYKRGNLLHQVGRFSEALDSFSKAIAIAPDFANAYLDRALTLTKLMRLDDALQDVDHALALQPSSAIAHNNRGLILQDQKRHDLALQSFDRAIAIRSETVEAHNNRSVSLHALGQIDEAIASAMRAVNLDNEFSIAFSNFLFCAQYGRARTPGDLLIEHQRFAAQFEEPLKDHWRPHPNSREPERRLKLGYVSADFFDHPVSYFVEPLLANHDKGRVEVYCFSCNTRADEITRRLSGYADVWEECGNLSAMELAEILRSREIDILIDLAGHTGNNRMLTFACKPAPIQLTYLGYPGTSGLTAMDYRLSDAHADPESAAPCYTEKLLRMPHSLWCYRPRADMPEVTPLPALSRGRVTFGSFNGFNKIDDASIELWADLLRAIPRSRLLMATVPEGNAQRQIVEKFRTFGVEPDRLEIHGNLAGPDFRRLLQTADITLDPVAVNGATTTCESLWLGVPVISLTGNRFLERAGLSILNAAGLDDFVAHTRERYIEIAAYYANHLEQLAGIRVSLRDKIAKSPLTDEASFTRSFEALCRQIWTEWCEKES